MMDALSDYDYKRLVSRATWLAVAIGFTLIIIKLLAWLLTDSISIFASLADSSLDISISLTNLIIVRFALQPADKEHSFGHGKLESLAALIQVVIIVGSAIFVLFSAVDRFYDRVQIEHTATGLIIMLISTLLTAVLVWYQRIVVLKTDSQAIKADAMHYKSDLLINCGVIAALLATYYSLYWVDSLAAVVIIGIMLFSARLIAVEAIDTLMDKNLPEEELAIIRKTIDQNPQVLGMHELRSRKAGKTRFIQFHLELPDDMLLLHAHAISDEIELQLTKELPGADILIHLDPASIVGKEQHD